MSSTHPKVGLSGVQGAPEWKMIFQEYTKQIKQSSYQKKQNPQQKAFKGQR